MIWMIASMFFYRIGIRDVLLPLAESQLLDQSEQKRVEDFVFLQNYLLTVFVFFTALLFLAM